jgi:hypothetical protein
MVLIRASAPLHQPASASLACHCRTTDFTHASDPFSR